jgi:hypothetical protein
MKSEQIDIQTLKIASSRKVPNGTVKKTKKKQGKTGRLKILQKFEEIRNQDEKLRKEKELYLELVGWEKPKPPKGGGRPNVMTEKVLYLLKEAYLVGATDIEACYHAGISNARLSEYKKEHPEFSEKIEEWKNVPIFTARKTVVANLHEVNTAKFYLERKVKNEFAQKTEISGNVNVSLPQVQDHLERLEAAYKQSEKTAGEIIEYVVEDNKKELNGE